MEVLRPDCAQAIAGDSAASSRVSCTRSSRHFCFDALNKALPMRVSSSAVLAVGSKCMAFAFPQMRIRLWPPLANRRKNIRDHFTFRFRSDVPFAVETDADGAGFQVTRTDYEHGMHFRPLGALDFAVDLVVGVIAFGADHVGAEFGHDSFGVVHQGFVIADGEHADLFGGEPEREVAGVMLDEEADEAFVRPERRAMDAERGLFGVVFVAIYEADTFRHGEVHLVGGQGEFAANDAPDLDVNLWAVE